MDDPTSYFVSPAIPSLAFTLSGVFMIAIGTFGVFANMVIINIVDKHVVCYSCVKAPSSLKNDVMYLERKGNFVNSENVNQGHITLSRYWN